MAKSRARDSLNSNSEKRPPRRKNAQQYKTSFRSTSAWQKFRKRMKRESGDLDYITGRHLAKGWSLHHMDLDRSHYTDISDDDRFVCMNSKTHEFIHWIYSLYEEDEEIIDRLDEVLHRMKEINCKEKDALPEDELPINMVSVEEKMDPS